MLPVHFNKSKAITAKYHTSLLYDLLRASLIAVFRSSLRCHNLYFKSSQAMARGMNEHYSWLMH
jgi:hypothetical protein